MVGSAAGGCEALEICGGRGLRVFSGLAVVGTGEGLSAPIGARARFHRGSVLYYLSFFFVAVTF